MARESSELESRFTDLALASANFGFLLPHEPLLVLYGASSEARASTAPAESVAAARQFAEVLATKLVHMAGVRPPTADQPSRLRVLTRAGLLAPRVLAAFEDLHGFPDGDGDRTEAVASRPVHRCYELAVWFFRLQTADQEPMPFVHSSASDLRVLSKRVAPMDAVEPRLRREFDLRVGPTSLPASERERLIVSARDAAHEPLEEGAIGAEVQRRLTKAGWDVLGPDADDDRNRSLGCVLVEPRLPGGRRADLLLLVGGQVMGIIEWKRDGADLGTAMEQAGRLAAAATDASPWPVWRSPLPYRYVSDGRRLLFYDANDPESGARLISGFHQPTTLARWRREAEADGEAPTYRARMAALPPLQMGTQAAGRLRSPQLQAVSAVERALAAGNRRALVQMATGTGRIYAEVFAAYRQLRHARAARILFVVDRLDMAHQLTAVLRQFTFPDTGRSLADVYQVAELTSADVPASASVVVGTTQRLESVLAGTPEPEDGSARVSAYETAEQVSQSATAPLEVTYAPTLPPDSFDLVIVDDCHHQVYGRGRALLEYFDAPVLGFTATPVAPVFGFFNANLVSEYSFEQAVADGLVVDYSLYQARFEPSGRATLVPFAGHIAAEAKAPRRTSYEQLDEDLAHAGPASAPRTVGSKQLAAVITAFRDELPALFPERAAEGGLGVPKTVVFALHDAHAEDIVHHVREVFGADDTFCQKITTRSHNPDQLLRDFRTDPQFRIGVVVDIMSGPTDMRAVECVLFLRDVRSAAYYERLLAQGAQPIAPAVLRAVTPGAFAKTQFVVIDAVGTSRHHHRRLVNVTDASGRAGRRALERLLERTVDAHLSADETAELGVRLARLVPVVSDADGAAVRKLAGISLEGLVARLLGTVDADHVAQVRTAWTPQALEEEVRDAGELLGTRPALRELLLRLYDGPAVPAAGEPTGPSAAAEDMRRRLAAFLQQAGPFTPAQAWWIENIAEATAAAEDRFDPRELDSVPFSGRGGTDGFLGAFGAEAAIGLIDDLGEALA
ncbi:DEAD/DEAH box helicase family protein [Streptomyces sp. NBC_01221]|uniref:DEAD/DEAH box helicase family protein n=1 Tax=unclassified Streptomyces TaxID=2593676 RepID=UPI00224D4E65|nr:MULTISPECIES: DEAD/DEAH box helicase family protein [unclassified Streptomyces]MCX4735074.1 DEAD/DEAH box helicase family protein [Streptomyces sp. NBC_01363]MCX4789702.1 DEAD/DEAH box helicase family protein [Streptomyces sp. NBC_01221]